MVVACGSQDEAKQTVSVVTHRDVAEAVAMVQSDSPLVAIEGLAKLAHVTFNDSMGKEVAGKAGAIKAIVDAMERNIANGTVQEDGCHALRNVAFHCLPNLVRVREQGAIAAVLKAMERHLENVAVQAEGCWALLVFCSNTEENTAVAKSQVALVHKAIATYPTNADIQSRGRFLTALFA